MIIGEIGQNHCGNMALAKKLIHLAKDNGADLVKFQLYDHKVLYGGNPKIPKVELSFEQAKSLFLYGEEVGIEVFFSVFDVERVGWCEEIGVKRYKIACRMRDEAVLNAIGSTEKSFFVSSELGEEVILANSHLDLFRKGRILYCIPKYPCLLSSLTMSEIIRIKGFSDHTIGIDAAKIALARGANIIEKHFCLSHDLGIDAAWSMDATELRELKRWEIVCNEVL